MAPHILLIDRGESVVSGALISWPRIRSVIAHQWEMSAEMLIWLCHCPPEALTISRLGPIHIAHGGSWAQSQELESLRWGYLDRPLIHGKAVGIRPDPCNGGWRALSSWEASNAQRVFSEHGSPITQRSCRIWERFGWQWMGGERRQRWCLGDHNSRAAIVAEVQAERLAAERQAAAWAAR